METLERVLTAKILKVAAQVDESKIAVANISGKLKKKDKPVV